MTEEASSGDTHHLVVMGVAGCGKTTVGRRLAEELGYEFAEGDDFHPAANRTKMAAGEPLTDDDRWPWLESLARWTAEERAAGRSTVVACSALRRAYRDVLRRADPTTFFVLLSRMEGREHFMPVGLLRSQLDTLEPLEEDESGVTLDVTASVDDLYREAVKALRSA